MTIGEHMYAGMGAAAWLLALCLIAYGVALIAKAGEESAKGKEAQRHAGTPADRRQPYGHAPSVGRHVRKGL